MSALTVSAAMLLVAVLADAQPPAAPALPPAGRAQPPTATNELGEKWIRVATDDNGQPTGMQTALVRYARPAAAGKRAAVVDLIGAVHVGDPAYYAWLNQRFREYDALLYELVAAEGTVVPKGTQADTRGPLGMLQGGMGAVLELVHQVEHVDYTRPNFVHADMSPQEFFQSMEQRGESVLQMVLELMLTAPVDNSKEGQAKSAKDQADLLLALLSDDRARRLKLIAARQFEESESLLTGFGGEAGSTIIHERNKRALDVLRRELNAGKTRLGVFYGAGHLVDMHQRLVKDFGFQPQAIQWVTAWDLRPEADKRAQQ